MISPEFSDHTDTRQAITMYAKVFIPNAPQLN